MKKVLVCIAGPAGQGKTTLAELVKLHLWSRAWNSVIVDSFALADSLRRAAQQLFQSDPAAFILLGNKSPAAKAALEAAARRYLNQLVSLLQETQPNQLAAIAAQFISDYFEAVEDLKGLETAVALVDDVRRLQELELLRDVAELLGAEFYSVAILPRSSDGTRDEQWDPQLAEAPVMFRLVRDHPTIAQLDPWAAQIANLILKGGNNE